MAAEARQTLAGAASAGRTAAALPSAAPQPQVTEVSHAVTRDQAARNKTKPAVIEYLRHAQQKSGRSPMDLVREFFRLSRGPGKLTLAEYVQLGVYDQARHSAADQARFISLNLHWPITHVCCDMTWQATTEDKWLCSHILSRSSVPVPETLAVIDKTDRAYPDTRKIKTAENLRDFLKSQGTLPLFGKENRGICSFGAFQVLDADDRALLLKGEGWITYDAFMEQFAGTTPYLLQRLERNHSFFDRYTESLATVRVCILNAKNGLHIPFAVLKLPSRNNVADSFWRPGNLACKLELQTGKILTARTQDHFGTTEHVTHPETGARLIGETVPMWERVLELVHTCAPIFQPLRYQSMDIAVTQRGAVLIEINTGGGFDLPQLATSDGFLTDEVQEFFRSCGYKKI